MDDAKRIGMWANALDATGAEARRSVDSLEIDITKASLRTLPRHVVARVREVRRNGDDPEAHKVLVWHSAMITLSMVLTVTCTLVTISFLHFDLIVPVLPSYLQEGWDWLYRH